MMACNGTRPNQCDRTTTPGCASSCCGPSSMMRGGFAATRECSRAFVLRMTTRSTWSTAGRLRSRPSVASRATWSPARTTARSVSGCRVRRLTVRASPSAPPQRRPREPSRMLVVGSKIKKRIQTQPRHSPEPAAPTAGLPIRPRPGILSSPENPPSRLSINDPRRAQARRATQAGRQIQSASLANALAAWSRSKWP